MKGHAGPDTNAQMSAVFKQRKNKAQLRKYIYIHSKQRNRRALVKILKCQLCAKKMKIKLYSNIYIYKSIKDEGRDRS